MIIEDGTIRFAIRVNTLKRVLAAVLCLIGLGASVVEYLLQHQWQSMYVGWAGLAATGLGTLGFLCVVFKPHLRLPLAILAFGAGVAAQCYNVAHMYL